MGFGYDGKFSCTCFLRGTCDDTNSTGNMIATKLSFNVRIGFMLFVRVLNGDLKVCDSQ